MSEDYVGDCEDEVRMTYLTFVPIAGSLPLLVFRHGVCRALQLQAICQ